MGDLSEGPGIESRNREKIDIDPVREYMDINPVPPQSTRSR